MINWTYNGEEVTEMPEGMLGFVYLITELSTGKKYIGKKLAKTMRKLKPLKGKKRSRRVLKDTDWKKYYGSSEALCEALDKDGPENYTREILHFCKSKGDMNFLEMYTQVQRNVLFDDTYYNKYISVKIHQKHLGISHEDLPHS